MTRLNEPKIIMGKSKVRFIRGIRDGFAETAMHSLLMSYQDWEPEEIAKLSYRFADSMIAERDKEAK